MRLAVFIFSFYLVFGQIYAHAGLPILGGAVAVARGTGTLVKAGKVAKGGAMLLGGAVYAWCKANKAKCKDLAGDAVDLIMGDDDEYGVPTEDCGGRWMYGTLQGGNHTSSASHLSHAKKIFTPYALEKSRNNAPHKPYKDPNFRYDGGEYVRDGEVYRNVIYDVYDFWGRDSSEIVQVYRYCDKTQDKPSDDDLKREREEEQKKREKELWDKLKDKLSDDDITNIVNNYGDDIDIDKYCASGATCYFIDTDFEKEINNNDYDIDKVNNQNCNTQGGKIVSCPNAKKKKDDDGQTGDKDKDKTKKDKDDDDTTRPTTKKDDDDDKPINCKSSEFHKKICDWIDWTQKKFDDDSDTRVKVKEEDEPTLDRNRINFNGHCPSPETTMISYAGVSQPIIIRYDNYCAFFIKLKPLLIGVAGIISVMIISGRKMGS